jgi:hypothetical protein
MSLSSSITTAIIRSITLSPSSLSLSLKISLISKLLIRGIAFPSLIWWPLSFLIPPIRSSLSNYCNQLVTIILLLGEVILSYSCYMEKKLVYIAITSLSGRQPSSYAKCTKLNIRLSCDVRSISNTKYTRPNIYYRRLIPCLIYYRVPYLILCVPP